MSVALPIRAHRSRIHMLMVAAARLQEEHASPKLVEDLRAAASEYASRKAQGIGWTDDDERRVERQRTLFNALPSSSATDRLKEAMLQRAYDVLWDGNAAACDALLEFLPSDDVQRLLDAWENDQFSKEPRSKWHAGGEA